MMTASAVRAIVGDTVYLPCFVEGAPTPETVWFRHHAELPTNSHVFPNHTLKLAGLTADDAGYYVCSATNALGKDEITTSVLLYRK